MKTAWLALIASIVCAQRIPLEGLRAPVEIRRDRWGVPHIYAANQDDLFFAQGYITARDRLYQIDLWRRAGNGRLAEVLGADYVERDRLALLFRFRGDWKKEWTSYAPDTWRIANSFIGGINSYIRSMRSSPGADFRAAGYEPGLWTPNDILTRIPALSMTHNATKELARVRDIRSFGIDLVRGYLPVDPPVPITIPSGLALDDIPPSLLEGFSQVVRMTELGEAGSNNWAVSGTRSTSGKPMMASDPHRRLMIPSLRKTVHLVAPGWDAIGAGDPALPGISLGHNQHIAFGFTIAGVDQQDLYVETLHPSDEMQYRYRGEWRRMEVERHRIQVKGGASQVVELQYTLHGPVLEIDRTKRRAFVLRWVGTEPGTAGYLASLSVARASNWQEFSAAMERFRSPAENMIYADTSGNIGWIVGALTPRRRNWNGLVPVPGDSGEYEWAGFLPPSELPRVLNPPERFWLTANHNILPGAYPHALQYEWAQPWRALRIREMLRARQRFSLADFQKMQQDVVSLPARRLQALLKKWKPLPPGRAGEAVSRLLAWDASLDAGSAAAMIYEAWMSRIPSRLTPSPDLGARLDLRRVFELLERAPDWNALSRTLEAALDDLSGAFGPAADAWAWGKLHQLHLRHPLGRPEFHRGPFPRPGDANTVNAASGSRFRQTNGASYRQVFDLADWDRAVITNLPGESGDPLSPHYSDLAADWAAGRYHPLPYSRAAVEKATVERILLVPLP